MSSTISSIIKAARTFERLFDDAENGTCKTIAPMGIVTAIGSEPLVGSDDGKLVLKCKGGYLVAYATGDPGIFDEIAVDFVSDDGRLLQLATVGRDEYPDADEDYESDGWDVVDSDDFGYQPMHVYAWDGVHEDVANTTYVAIDDDSHWYEED